MRRTIHLIPALLSITVPPAAATAAMSKAATQTEAAVLDADQKWGAAENSGDYQFVDWLLLPDYVSVNSNGGTTTKAAIVGAARKRHLSNQPAADMAAWNVQHPHRGEVTIVDDTAIVRWVSQRPGSEGSISSCDVFVLHGGEWHAAYSQHTAAAL